MFGGRKTANSVHADGNGSKPCRNVFSLHYIFTDAKNNEGGAPMATSSILEHITINNPHFMEMYADHMESSTGVSKLQRRTKSEIVLADREECRRMAEVRSNSGN